MVSTHHATARASAWLADLDAIARIEAALAPRKRRASRDAQPDFSRLARFLPGLTL